MGALAGSVLNVKVLIHFSETRIKKQLKCKETKWTDGRKDPAEQELLFAIFNKLMDSKNKKRTIQNTVC